MRSSSSQYDITLGMLVADRQAVESLLRACRSADGVDDAFFLDAPSLGADAIARFGVVEQGELIGFAHLPDDPEPEASVIVHPKARRRGIGRALAETVRAEANRRGLRDILLVTNAGSSAGVAFLAGIGAGYVFSENRLAYRADVDGTGDAPRAPDLMLIEASPTDFETLVRIRAAAFGDDLAETRAEIGRRLTEPNRRYFLGMLAGEPIGMLRTGAWVEEADITSFGVLPEWQGRGYGRQLLRDAVALLRDEGWTRITIEVATDNERALGLYRSCGFVPIAQFDYHRLIVS